MRINPIDYLYYKIHRGLSNIDGVEHSISKLPATVLLLNINYAIIWILTLKDIGMMFFTVSEIFIGIGMFVYYYLREDYIIAKYSQETEQSRIIGNAIVIIYVILTYFSLFWIFCSDPFTLS